MADSSTASSENATPVASPDEPAHFTVRNGADGDHKKVTLLLWPDGRVTWEDLRRDEIRDPDDY
ncbi:hypothetical protein [Blastococcus sp. TF02A-35]|uniref:hypothetical protein n=1 Tax=Blastococcus sp. TF02A-35 TaxID=2559612 RepID=UPI001073D841|nr:hypothetical protein [Blastococcus sp. TF02A_35]TFV48194.1 hypothetical protein E4P43_14050 [Blastococcus sp. TF02A_35]